MFKFKFDIEDKILFFKVLLSIEFPEEPFNIIKFELKDIFLSKFFQFEDSNIACFAYAAHLLCFSKKA